MNSNPLSLDTDSLTFNYSTTHPVSIKLEFFDSLKCFTQELNNTDKEKDVVFKEGEISIKLNTKYFKHFVVQISNVKKETTIDFSIKNHEKLIDQDKKILKPTNKNIAICYIFHNHVDKTWNFLQLNYPNEDLYLGKNRQKICRKVIPFHFIEQTEILNIKFLRGNDLAIQDLNGFSDPYCIIKIGKTKLKTTVKYKTLNPIWEEQLDVKLTNPGSFDQIIIDCWDYDLAKPHDFLGQILINPSTLDLKKKLIIDLKKREKKKDFHVKGSLELVFDINQKDTISEHQLSIFGKSMNEVMERNHETEKYPKQIKVLLDYLMINGPKLEGVFRKTASVSKVKEFQNILDSGENVDLKNCSENQINNIASLFKSYLRLLPNPLLTWELYDEFLAAAAYTEDKKLLQYARLLTDIPFFNRGILYDLMTLCNKINDNNEKNLMNFRNLAVIFGVCLLQTKDDMRNMKENILVQDVCIDLMQMHPKHFEIAEQMMEEEE
eukprot:gene7698-12164_t